MLKTSELCLPEILSLCYPENQKMCLVVDITFLSHVLNIQITFQRVLGFENVFVFSACKKSMYHPKRIPNNRSSVLGAML
jgi:hypothetical protein